MFECTSFKSWNAMLNTRKVELEFNSHADMYLFFEKCMGGGVSYITKRYSKTNNKYLKTYDPKQEPKHIIYLDQNNLYGYAMRKFLPTSGFKRTDSKGFDLNKYTSNSSKQFFSELILNILNNIDKLHNDYPLVPDEIEIKKDILP